MNKIINENNIKEYKYYKNNNKIILSPLNNTDYWCNTYYEPIYLQNNAPIITFPIVESIASFETQMIIHTNGNSQFNQGGVMVYIDDNTWIKTGIEFVDKEPYISVVVTNKFSDWSTSLINDKIIIQKYKKTNKLLIYLRIQKINLDFVIEYKTENDKNYKFIRICHLNIDNDKINNVLFGLYAAAPKKEILSKDNDLIIEFSNFNLNDDGKLLKLEHSSSL